MSDCYSPADQNGRQKHKSRCPICDRECLDSMSKSHGTEHQARVDIPSVTIATCEAVYFEEDGSPISKRQLRTVIGIKEVLGLGLLLRRQQ